MRQDIELHKHLESHRMDLAGVGLCVENEYVELLQWFFSNFSL